MGTTFLRSDSDKWGQGLKWGQSESRDNLLFHRGMAVTPHYFADLVTLFQPRGADRRFCPPFTTRTPNSFHLQSSLYLIWGHTYMTVDC